MFVALAPSYVDIDYLDGQETFAFALAFVFPSIFLTRFCSYPVIFPSRRKTSLALAFDVFVYYAALSYGTLTDDIQYAHYVPASNVFRDPCLQYYLVFSKRAYQVVGHV